jgi:hypothetical protein
MKDKFEGFRRYDADNDSVMDANMVRIASFYVGVEYSDRLQLVVWASIATDRRDEFSLKSDHTILRSVKASMQSSKIPYRRNRKQQMRTR